MPSVINFDKEKASKSWHRLLNPEELKKNLIQASIFITAYEVMRDSIVDRVRNFYIRGFENDKWIISEDYKTEGGNTTSNKAATRRGRTTPSSGHPNRNRRNLCQMRL